MRTSLFEKWTRPDLIRWAYYDKRSFNFEKNPHRITWQIHSRYLPEKRHKTSYRVSLSKYSSLFENALPIVY